MPNGGYSLLLEKRIKEFNKITNIDSDKSISIRSFIVGSISQGVSKVKNVLESQDVFSTINCLRKLGSKIKKIRQGQYEIYGKGLGSFRCRKNMILDFGNSGTAARLITGALSTNPNIQVKIKGDKSLNRRSMLKIVRAMEGFGAEFLPKNKFRFPLTLISSEMPVGIKYNAGISAQIKSAVILAGLFSYGKTIIFEKIKSRNHTEKMLKHNINAIKIKKGKQNYIEVTGKENLKAINISVPGDPSSAAFFVALCLLNNNSKLIIKKTHINPTRIGFYKVLQKHGAKINFRNIKEQYNEKISDIHIYSSKIKPLKVGREFFVSCQDEFPIMFAIASLLRGTSSFKGIEDLKNKESNRIKEMQKILTQIGVKTRTTKDEMKIYGNPNLNTCGKKIGVLGVLDHRILMSSAIISLLTGIKADIKNFETVRTSSPNFLKIIKFLGGKFEIKKAS